MLEELVEVLMTVQEEEQRRFVCLMIQTTSMLLVQPVQVIILPYTEQNIKPTMDHFTACVSTMSPVLSAMLPPELQ
jgi:hypothetical protein